MKSGSATTLVNYEYPGDGPLFPRDEEIEEVAGTRIMDTGTSFGSKTFECDLEFKYSNGPDARAAILRLRELPGVTASLLRR